MIYFNLIQIWLQFDTETTTYISSCNEVDSGHFGSAVSKGGGALPLNICGWGRDSIVPPVFVQVISIQIQCAIHITLITSLADHLPFLQLRIC